MNLEQLFTDRKITDGMRLCGTCGKVKPVSEFYRDGTDRKTGEPKYRRDCKECYKATRMQADRRRNNE